MTAEMVPYEPPATRLPSWVDLMAPAVELAREIADTGFVPAEFRRKPAEIAAAILYGAELGIGPMQSLAKVDIVKGRPAPRAELGRALALAAGHDIWIDESTNTRVTVSGKRRGSARVQTVTWTMDDAKRAGIAGNPSYAKYPRQMLLARASAELVRAIFPEVLGGIVVFAEEAADLDDDVALPAAPPLAAVPPSGTKKRRRRIDAPEGGSSSAPERGEELPPTERDEPDADKPSEAQTKLAMAAFAELDLDDRDDRLAATSALLGRPIETWNELSRSDASSVIDGLERLRAGTISFRIDPDGTWHADPVDDDLDD
jgi:hypothetical protein